MLGQENTMSIDDLEFISPSLGSTFKSLNKIVQKRYMLEKELKLVRYWFNVFNNFYIS